MFKVTVQGKRPSPLPKKPNGIEDIITSCWQSSPSSRPPATAVAEELKKLNAIPQVNDWDFPHEIFSCSKWKKIGGSEEGEGTKGSHLILDLEKEGFKDHFEKMKQFCISSMIDSQRKRFKITRIAAIRNGVQQGLFETKLRELTMKSHEEAFKPEVSRNYSLFIMIIFYFFIPFSFAFFLPFASQFLLRATYHYFLFLVVQTNSLV